MNIRNFRYKETPRIVAVIEENDTNIKGFDLSKIMDNNEKETAKKLCESANTESSGKFSEDNFEKVKHLMKYYRNFRKASINE